MKKSALKAETPIRTGKTLSRSVRSNSSKTRREDRTQEIKESKTNLKGLMRRKENLLRPVMKRSLVFVAMATKLTSPEIV